NRDPDNNQNFDNRDPDNNQNFDNRDPDNNRNLTNPPLIESKQQPRQSRRLRQLGVEHQQPAVTARGRPSSAMLRRLEAFNQKGLKEA
ncbi:MAG: hypothetical protein AAFO91_09325, partial [Bacteroidota bacterium]